MGFKNKRIMDEKSSSNKHRIGRMKKFLARLILLLFIQSCVTSKSALKNFNNAEFNSAAEKYEQIVKTNDAKTNFLLAESYRKSNQIIKSIKYYKDAISNGHEDEIINYYLTLSLKANNPFDSEYLAVFISIPYTFNFFENSIWTLVGSINIITFIFGSTVLSLACNIL